MKGLVYILISVWFAIGVNLNAQEITKKDLIGRWQLGSPNVSDMYLDNYQFFNNDTFKFTPNAYDGLRRLIWLAGTYRIKGDSLMLKVEYSVEQYDGYPEKSHTTTLSGGWEISDGTLIKKTYDNLEDEIFKTKFENDKSILVLDNRKFYKIKDDPNDY